VHAASYFLQPKLAVRLPELLRTARAAGATTSLDTNHDPAGRWELAAGLLDACDYVLPNESEALALTGTSGLEDAIAVFGPTPIIKRGRDGAIARHAGRILEVDGPALDPVDTVGAGDSFDAGFLAGLLATGDLADAVALGCACGALSTRAAGGTAAQPGREEALALAGEYRRSWYGCDGS
jgi:sugar/nucleoside kinase (ribokinase family)